MKLIDFNTRTVLLVDDDTTIRALYGRVLAKQGYTVLEAANGLEALLVCAQHPGPIHLLLTDIVMPGMDGIELAQAFTTLRPGVPVLCMSAVRARAGCDVPFIQKPFIAGALINRVSELLS